MQNAECKMRTVAALSCIFHFAFCITLSASVSTPTIVALGDSTTAGTPGFKSPIEAPPDGAGNVESQYACWLMKTHAEWRVLNRGVDGERSDQIRARFERDVLGKRGRERAAVPHLVAISADVNDICQRRPRDGVAGGRQW